MKIQCSNCNLFFEIDDEDTQKVLEHNTNWNARLKFSFRKQKYIVANIQCHSRILNKNVSLTHILIECPIGMERDHIDRNPLNNKKSNLRIVTRGQNQMNRLGCRGSNKYKNVFRNTKNHCFDISVRFNGKRYREYGFPDEEMAAEAANELLKKLHGEYAVLNNIILSKG
ncbi:MAG TPA: HNH endonuclease [Blattabacteriaceae bacterium]